MHNIIHNRLNCTAIAFDLGYFMFHERKAETGGQSRRPN